MINILMCGNDKVFDGMLTTTLSILKRSDTKNPVHLYIYTMDVSYLNPKYLALTEDMAKILDDTVKKYNPESQVTLIDVFPYYKKEFAGSPNEGCYCSPYTLLRLFADEIPNMPDKLLYLDCDLMFCKDISLLYEEDVEGYEYAAARDQYGKYLIQPNYINAGVLLFNLKRMKETGLLEKARHLIETKHLPFADQSAILRSTIKKRMLPQRFNDQRRIRKNTVIRHFAKRLYWWPYPHTDNIKQWHIDNVHKKLHYYQFDDIYQEYLDIKKQTEN